MSRVGWDANVYEGPTDWMRDYKRIVIVERHPDGGGRQLIGWDGLTEPIYAEVTPGAVLRDGFPVPADALRALGEQLNPVRRSPRCGG